MTRDLAQALAWIKTADLLEHPKGSSLYWHLEEILSWEDKNQAYAVFENYKIKYTDIDTLDTDIYIGR